MLTSEAVAFCRKLHSQSSRLLDIVYGHDPAVLEAVSLAIEAANASAPSHGARVVKWCILDKDFSVAGGELGEKRWDVLAWDGGTCCGGLGGEEALPLW